MFNAAALDLLARSTDIQADLMIRNGGCTESTVQPWRIAAADARAVAQSCNGYATPETLSFHICADNDQAMVEAMTERARTIVKRSDDLRDGLADVKGNPDQSADDQRRALTVSYLADDLRDWIRGDLLDEVNDRAHIRTIYGNDPDVQPTHKLRMASADLMHAMAHHALSQVDWISVAREHLDRANERGEYAPAGAEA